MAEPGEAPAALQLPTVDAHQRAWTAADVAALPPSADLEPLRRVYHAAEIVPELSRLGFGGSVLMQSEASLVATGELLASAEGLDFVRGVVGWVDLRSPRIAVDLARLQSGPGGSKLVGVRHRLHAEPDAAWLLRDDVRRGLRAVVDAGLAFDLDVRTRELPAAVELAGHIPELRLVLDHLARPPIAEGDLSAWGRALLPLAERPNVSAKISGLATAADWLTWSIDDLRQPVGLAVDAFGPERLMLGSDWPRCLLAGSYADAIDAVRYLLAELPTHQLDEIRGLTATRVYRLAAAGEAAPARRSHDGED
jgi:L-fuconolactonase